MWMLLKEALDALYTMLKNIYWNSINRSLIQKSFIYNNRIFAIHPIQFIYCVNNKMN